MHVIAVIWEYIYSHIQHIASSVYIAQAGIYSLFSIHKLVNGGSEFEIIGKAKEAAGPIYEIIDMVQYTQFY